MDAEQIKDMIEEKVWECVAKVNAHFKDKHFVEPNIFFDLQGMKNGTAIWTKWAVNFNLQMALANRERFINQTVPHEVAHLADMTVFRKWGHGKTWKYIMIKVFGLSPDRCSDLEIPADLKRNKMKTFIYTCACPGNEIQIKSRMHNIIQGGRHQICVRCRQRIQLKAYAGKL